MKDGRRFGKPPTPYDPPTWPQGKVNLTDPDSHVMKGNAMFMQAYNAQAVVNEQQIVLAAEISIEPIDFSSLKPMMTAARRELEQAGIDAIPEVAVADAGYWTSGTWTGWPLTGSRC